LAVTGYLALVADIEMGLRIIDLSDPTHLRELAVVPMRSGALSVTVTEGIAYVGVNGGPLLAIDVSDPRNPREIGSTDLLWSVDRIVVVGDYLYVAHFFSGLQVYRIRRGSQD